MGIAATCYLTVWKPGDAHEFLERAIVLGAGGIQASLNSQECADLKKLRDRAGEADLYIEVVGAMPRKGDTSAFERTVAAAKQVGALCVRCACLGRRRYDAEDSQESEIEGRCIGALLPGLTIMCRRRSASPARCLA
jgi:hypothetical protein